MAGKLALRRARKAGAEGDKALAAGDLAAAEAAFTSVVERLRNGLTGDADAAALAGAAGVGLGRVFLARNDLRAADQWFRQVQQLRPAEFDGYYWAGCAAAHGADYPRAEWYFGAALARDARSGRAYLQRAYVRLRQDRPGEALADLHAAADCNALDDRARLIAATLLLRAGRPAQAEAFAAAITPAGRSAQAAGVLAIARHQQGKIEQAQQAYAFAVSGGHTDDAVLQGHASTAYLAGQYLVSIASWRALHERHPADRRFAEHLALAHHAHAKSAVDNGDLAGAKEHLRAAADAAGLDVTAALAELHLRTAAQATERGDPVRARGDLVDAARLRPEDSRATHYLAVLDAQAGALDKAAEAWQQLVDAGGAGRKARFGLALCQTGQGETEAGERSLRELADDATDEVGSLAAQAIAALHVRRGDWAGAAAAIAALPDTDPLRGGFAAECLYRAGDDDALLALPDTAQTRLWQVLARLRSGEVQELPDIGDGADERARQELALRLRASAAHALTDADWDTAAWLLTDSDRVVPRAYPAVLDLLTFGLGGDRERAITALANASRDDPADHRLNHTLAVMLLHTLGADEPVAAASWPACVGAWLSVLHDEAFWEGWLRRTQERYGQPVSPRQAESLRTAVLSLLQQRAADADPAAAALLRREDAAAKLLGDLGGMPLPGTDDRLVCGPLRIAELGLHAEFGRFAASLRRDDRTDDLMILFSRLGFALTELTAERPESALAHAMDLRCPRCRDRAGTDDDKAKGPLQCRADCPDVARHNPGFAGLAHRDSELAEAASVLAISALLRLSRDAVSAGELDVPKVAAAWRDALAYADRFGQRDEVAGPVADVALGRAESLRRKGDHDLAISLLDAARAELRSGPDHERVCNELALLYTGRGIRAINDDMAKLHAGYRDVIKGLKLSPKLLRPLLNAGEVALLMAYEAIKKDDLEQCTRRLREAIGYFDRGLAEYPGHAELTKLRANANRDLTTVVALRVRQPYGRRR